MQDNDYYIILFYTIHDVLRAEKTLKQHNIPHELVPVPRNLSSDCGMCLKLHDDIDKALLLCSKMDVAGRYNAEGTELKEIKSI